MFTFNIIFRPEQEGGYTVIVPSLPGCITWAETIKDGKVLIKEAIDVYLESVNKHKDFDIQDDSNAFISSLNYEYA